MNTVHLKYIIVIAECHSINQAAQKLHLQHPYLSKILSGTEKMIGNKIFNRDHKGVTLTLAGEWFLQRASEIVRLAEELENGFATLENQIFPEYHDHLKLYSSTKQEIFDVIKLFRRHFPNVALTISEKNIYLLPAIVEKLPLASLAVYSQLNIRPLEQQILSPDLQFIPVIEAPVVALAAQTNFLGQKYQSISIATLAKQNLAIFGSNNQLTHSFLGSVFLKTETPNIHYTVTNLDLLFGLIRDQNYFSIGIKGMERPPDIIEIPLRENVRVQTGLLFHKNMADSFVGKNFINTYLSYYHMPPLA